MTADHAVAMLVNSSTAKLKRQLADKPVAICWGMKDVLFGEQVLEQWQQLFPHAQVHRVPDAGHFLPEDAPQQPSPADRLPLPTTHRPSPTGQSELRSTDAQTYTRSSRASFRDAADASSIRAYGAANVAVGVLVQDSRGSVATNTERWISRGCWRNPNPAVALLKDRRAGTASS